jgi:hypothetical protein
VKSGSISPSIAQSRKNHEQKTSSSFHLGTVFEKDANGRYTARARLYHDILSYALADRPRRVFLFNDLAKFVIQKNLEYRDYYSGSKAHVPMSARIANRRDTIQKCIDDLMQLTLIVQLGYAPALRNGLPTPKYVFTRSGKTVALFLKRLDASKRQSADEEIFQLLKHQYSESNAATNRFHLKFLKRLKRDGLLGKILNLVTDYLSHSHELEQILNVYGFVTFRAFTDPNIGKKVWRSFLATFGDVDDKTRRIVLRYEKASLENNIASGSRFRTKEWEDLWIENIVDDSKITLAGACENCIRTSAVIVDYFEYKKGLLTSKKGLYATECPKCKAKKSFYVLSGRDSKDIQQLLTLSFLEPLSS